MVMFTAPEDQIIRSAAASGTKNGTVNGTENGTVNLSATEETILDYIEQNNFATISEIMTSVSKGRTTVNRAIKALKEKGLISRIGSDKKGYWQIIGK